MAADRIMRLPREELDGRSLAEALDDPESTELARVTDIARQWWDEKVHGIAYRPRTAPETSVNVAFFHDAPLQGRSVRLDRARRPEQLIVRYGFTIDF